MGTARKEGTTVMKARVKRSMFAALAVASLALVLIACGGPWMHDRYHRGQGYDTYDDRRPPPADPRYSSPEAAPNWGPVTEKSRAEAMVRDMLIDSGNPNLKVGRVEDRGPFYEVEILTLSGALVDLMLVDKETGQMRSAYR